MTRRNFLTRTIAAIAGLFVAPKVVEAVVPEPLKFTGGPVTLWDVTTHGVMSVADARAIDALLLGRKNGKTQLQLQLAEEWMKRHLIDGGVAFVVPNHFPDTTKMVTPHTPATPNSTP